MQENKQFKILMVDDVPQNLQVLGSTLKDENHKIEFATDGQKALDWVARDSFDLVLLDVMMPGMTGYEVCETIRKDEKLKDLPIIFLTAKSDAESIAKCFEVGGQDFVSKPFNAAELLTRVNTQLKIRAQYQEIKALKETIKQMKQG